MRKYIYCGNILGVCLFPLPDLQLQLCNAHPHKHPSLQKSTRTLSNLKRKLTTLCAPATDPNYVPRDPQARKDSARRPSFPNFILNIFFKQPPKARLQRGIYCVFRGIHSTEDPSPRDRALRPLSKAQHRLGSTVPSQTPGPRPHRGRGRGRRGGSLPLGRCRLHAVAAVAPRGRRPSPRAPPDPHSSRAISAPLDTESTPSHGRAPATATTATSGRGGGPPATAAHWLQPRQRRC